MKRPASGGSCRASAVVLGLLVAFALVIFTVFVFTLRPGHPLRKASASLGADVEMDREIKLAIRDPLEHNDSVGVYGYEVVQEFNHDATAFTQVNEPSSLSNPQLKGRGL